MHWYILVSALSCCTV